MTEFLVSRRYTQDSRFYKIERGGSVAYYPSVTTILGSVKVSTFLDDWKMEQAEKLGVLGQRINLFLAAERGVAVHSTIEEYNIQHMSGVHVPIEWANHTDEEWTCVMRYDQWFRLRNPKPVGTEQIVWSDEHGFAGQADAIMEFDFEDTDKRTKIGRIKGKYLVDFKTSKDVMDDYLLQIAAYVIAYEEQTGEKLDGALILALRTTTKKGYKECYLTRAEIDHYFEGFIRRKAVFDWERKDFRPEMELMPESISPLIK